MPGHKPSLGLEVFRFGIAFEIRRAWRGRLLLKQLLLVSHASGTPMGHTSMFFCRDFESFKCAGTCGLLTTSFARDSTFRLLAYRTHSEHL